MIKTFKHKGLKQYWDKGTTKGIQAKHAKRLKNMLVVLNNAEYVDEIICFPAFKAHQLHRDKKPWSLTVNGNWRLTFVFEDGNVYILDYEDYH
jgi:proteic killer suppression protein